MRHRVLTSVAQPVRICCKRGKASPSRGSRLTRQEESVMVSQAAPTRRREATPERWAKALERAVANGLEVFQVADTGERLVTSASRLDTLHRSDGYGCTCEAAVAGDEV